MTKLSLTGLQAKNENSIEKRMLHQEKYFYFIFKRKPGQNKVQIVDEEVTGVIF